MLVSTRYDLIHSHEEAAFFSVALASVFRTRHLYDMHSNLDRQVALSRFGRWRWLVRLFDSLERWAINTCDAVITVGADLEQRVKATNPDVEQITIQNLPVGTEGDNGHRSSADPFAEEFTLDHRLPVVYTGNFEHYQGIDLLIDSAKIVGDRCPEAVFLLVGGRPEQIEYWRNETRLRQADGCVRFAGPVPMEQIYHYLELAEILVSPRKEGTSVPLKIYSYLLSGKPIVATNLAAHTEILNEDIAVLASATAEEFAKGILKLIVSPELRQRLGSRAREFAMKEHSSVDYVARLGQIYQTLLPPATALEPSSHISVNS
jgi:glycosyltransferase involved in cell wall biosynthesis